MSQQLPFKCYALSSSSANQKYKPLQRGETPVVTKTSSCPVSQEKDGKQVDILCEFDEKVKKHVELDALGEGNIAVGRFEKIKLQVTYFFDSLSKLGRADNSKNPPSVIAGIAAAIAYAFFSCDEMQSVHSFLANAASDLFKSNVDEVARTAFSGLCVLSAALRATIPVMRQFAMDSHDPGATLFFTGALFVLSCVYAATSFVNFLLAPHDAIALQPKNSKVMLSLQSTYKNARGKIDNFLKDPDKAKAIASWAAGKIEEKLERVRNATVNGVLNTAREFFMLAGAVLSIIAVKASIPVLLIAAGAVGVVANFCDVIQGARDCHIFNKKINGLEEKNKELELALKQGNLSENEKKIVNALVKEIQDEIDKARSELRASGLRIAKGAVGMLCSISSIVTGVLATFFSVTVPVLPLVATVVSLVAVIVLSSVGLARRKIKNEDKEREAIKKEATEEIFSAVNVDNKVEAPSVAEDENFSNKYYLFRFVTYDFISENKAHDQMYAAIFSDEQRIILGNIVQSYKAGREAENLEERKRVRRLEGKKTCEQQEKLYVLHQLMQLDEGGRIKWKKELEEQGKTEQMKVLQELMQLDEEGRLKWKKELERQYGQTRTDSQKALIQLDEKERLERKAQLAQLEQHIAAYLKIKIDKPSKAKNKLPQKTTRASITSPSSDVHPKPIILGAQTISA
jgi:hypothetical protein